MTIEIWIGGVKVTPISADEATKIVEPDPDVIPITRGRWGSGPREPADPHRRAQSAKPCPNA